jgi:hypothetical protein
MSVSSEYSAIATLDERPSEPWRAHGEDDDASSPFESVTDAHPKADDPDDPLDPIEGKTTRMDVPPPSAPVEDAPSWANEVPSKLEMIDDLGVQPPPVAPPEFHIPPKPPLDEAVDYSPAWDTRPPPEMLPAEATSSVFEALDSNPQREVEEPLAGATTWKPTADRAITDLDLSERAQRLQVSNAETRPELEKVILGHPITIAPIVRSVAERVMVESSPAGVLPHFAQSAPVIPPRSIDEMMPEEATLAGGPPVDMQQDPVVSEDPEKEPVEDPSQTMAGPLAPPGDEAPTWAPEHNSELARAALKEAREASALKEARETAAREAAALKETRDAAAIRAARRAPTKLDDAAIVEEALGSHQRYLITVGFAILGLLAGVATALLS